MQGSNLREIGLRSDFKLQLLTQKESWVERHNEHLFYEKVVGGSKFWRKWRGVLVMPLHVGDVPSYQAQYCSELAVRQLMSFGTTTLLFYRRLAVWNISWISCGNPFFASIFA